MTYDRPQRPNLRPNRPQANPPRQGGGDRRGNGRNGGHQGGQAPPSPWLEHPLHPNGTPSTHKTAGFVEYLRWMRSPDGAYKDLTKVQILQIAEEAANYRARLETLNRRLKQMAGPNNWFEVTCPWRIRVGGTKGPESMLLPAFDALGMPYIPSSTLRGVARAYAIRDFMKSKGMSWPEGDRHVEAWFGHLDGKEDNRAGKVIFLDAYPTPSQNGGLAMDMANNLWRWDRDQLGNYSPNPNPFFSLRNVSWLVGLRPLRPEYAEAAQQVRAWLMAGLAQGIGSQVNSGYGFVREQGSTHLPEGFFRVDFEVYGQLVHSLRRLNLKYPLRENGQANYALAAGNGEELRSVAIKGLLRYWFRVFALGVLPNPEVKLAEERIFGGIDPKTRGCLGVYVFEDENSHQPAPELNKDGKDKPHGRQKGQLILSRSSEPVPPQIEDKSSFEASLAILAQELVWLAFHLGGVGQGARRPLYSRNNRKDGKPPWWRGSTLVPTYSNSFPKPRDFVKEFGEHLQRFYEALEQISLTSRVPLRSVVQANESVWEEAADAHCQIWLMPNSSATSSQPNPTARPPRSGQSPPSRSISGAKLKSLQILHNSVHLLLDVYQRKKNSTDKSEKAEAYKALTEAKNLCGHTDTDYPNGKKREATPSPIWIANHESHQVVTVFGATQDPRKKFVDQLKRQGAIQLFPLSPEK